MNSVLSSPVAGPAAVNAPAEPRAVAASAELDDGTVAQCRRSLTLTEDLNRSSVAAPPHSGPGSAWLAYLDKEQPDFRMLDEFETGRTLSQLRDRARSASDVGHFADPERSTEPAQQHLAAHGLA